MTIIEKDHILTEACQGVDEAFARNPHDHAPGTEVVPLADPDWNYNTQERMARCIIFLETLMGRGRKEKKEYKSHEL